MGIVQGKGLGWKEGSNRKGGGNRKGTPCTPANKCRSRLGLKASFLDIEPFPFAPQRLPGWKGRPDMKALGRKREAKSCTDASKGEVAEEGLTRALDAQTSAHLWPCSHSRGGLGRLPGHARLPDNNSGPHFFPAIQEAINPQPQTLFKTHLVT